MAHAPLGLPELLTHAHELVAVFTDMDGTLLLPDSTLPPEAPAAIRRLQATGARLVPTSGRALWSLQAVFGELAPEMDFVAANGMDVVARGKVLRHERYRPEDALRLLDAVRTGPWEATMILFDEGGSYLYEGPAEFARQCATSLREGVVRTGTDALPDGPITKLAVVTTGDARTMADGLNRTLGDVFAFAPCGGSWVDVLVRGVTKATGIQLLLDHYGASPAQAAGFGDSMNDAEMMRLVGHAVAVENAMPELAALCAYRIGSCAQASVTDAASRIAALREEAGLTA